MRYTDIAWDFDGTLVDSFPNCVRAFREALECYGYTADEAEIREKMTVTIGYMRRYYVEKFGLQSQEKELHQKYRELESSRPEAVKLYPGVAEVLKSIQDSGRRNHLYTNRSQDAVWYLEYLGIRQYFEGIITKDKFERFKPEPDGMLLLCQQYEVAPENVLMVGDRDVDIRAAKQAGADGCFFNTNQIEVPEGTDFVIDQIEELLRYL